METHVKLSALMDAKRRIAHIWTDLLVVDAAFQVAGMPERGQLTQCRTSMAVTTDQVDRRIADLTRELASENLTRCRDCAHAKAKLGETIESGFAVTCRAEGSPFRGAQLASFVPRNCSKFEAR